MTDFDDTRVNVLLTMQRALLGEIFPRLEKVDVTWEPGKILMTFFVTSPLDDTDRDTVTSIEAEMCADWPDEDIESEIVVNDVRPSRRGMECVFSRRPD